MDKSITIRKANISDIPFLAKVIIMSESSGHELTSYKKMFGLSQTKLLKKMEQVLNNDQPGHALTYHSFLVAEINGIQASASAGYIEGEYGNSSHLMTGALLNVFSTEEMLKAFEINKVYNHIQIVKSPQTLQIDSGATLKEYRRLGLFGKLYYNHIEIAKKKNCKSAEFHVWAGNQSAILAYQKLGLSIKLEKKITSGIDVIGGRILMTSLI